MQSIIYNEDQGINFGKWDNDTANFIYSKSTKEILNLITIPEKVADYGGANGNLKQFIPQAISVDVDQTKKPDILDNILTHVGEYDLIVIRYVLHYLNDYEVINLFQHIKKFHIGKILIIQFCNNNLKIKYKNSQNEFKYFRTETQLEALLFNVDKIYTSEYLCTSQFYKDRLNINNAISHIETLNAYVYN